MNAPVKATPAAQIAWKFAGEDRDLFHVDPLSSQEEATELSITLAEGMEMLCGRLATSTNYNDDPVSIAELLTLGVVAGAINSLLKTVRSKRESEQGGPV
ncbi:hypothetical protein YA0002_11475 [Pseudomonas cichorii]|uniref:hypothetical protein n=1 Tax=Pseudomonas cichorii TaxID=36746 RepID=UPI0018E63AB2|nr:hypothetical protein [Pseudomonas cichorii]MBI6853387.1 hypothetical protein [Pseudomonas cichorii]